MSKIDWMSNFDSLAGLLLFIMDINYEQEDLLSHYRDQSHGI